jgi:type IV pilus assembly protein PilE
MDVTVRRRQVGFSIVELMVAVAILGVLAAIAIPAYNSQVRKSRRTDARTALLDLAGREEKLNSTMSIYSANFTQLGWATTATWMPVGSGYYQVSIVVGVPRLGSGLPYTYTLTAVPTGGSDQLNDTACQKFTVDNLGTQKSYDSTNADTSTVCWH